MRRLSIIVFFSFPLLAMSQSGNQGLLGRLLNKAKMSYSKEAVLGNLLQNYLENMHLSEKRIDDDFSKLAYKEFLERIDFGKQFLLQSDVDQLEKFKSQFDDQLKSGNLVIIEVSNKIVRQRRKEVEKMVFDLLGGKFDFSKKETVETDAEKRKFPKTKKERRELWRKLLKLEVLSRLADYTQDIEDQKKEKASPKKEKKKAKKKAKKSDDDVDLAKLSPKQLQQRAIDKVTKSYKRIFARLSKERSNDALDKFYNSITRIFDPHTHYLIPEEKEDFDIDMSGKLEGIGAVLREEGPFIKVERIVPGSASWRQKELQAEDVILMVGQGDEEPVDIVDMGLRDAVKLIRGEKGSTVKLRVRKPNGLKKTIAIIRDVVEIAESYVKGGLIEDTKAKKRFGYIKVPKFYRDFSNRNGRNCSEDTLREIEKLKKMKIDGLILDLRNNGGGALEDARLISGLFIDRGPIVQVKSHTGSVEVLSDNDGKTYYGGPLIVLINKFSASASEIVAAAMQDYGRAIVMGGDYSHGKGTVQAVIELDNQTNPIIRAHSPLGALKITIQKFYRITGGSTQYKGVTPDIVLPDPFGHLESGEKYLDYSLPWGKVAAKKFSLWSKIPYPLEKLKRQSKERIAKNEKFQKILKSNQLFLKRKEQTQRSLNKSEYLSFRKKLSEDANTLKSESVYARLKVSETPPTPGVSNGRVADAKVQAEKLKEFSESITKDPVVSEATHVLTDLLKAL